MVAGSSPARLTMRYGRRAVETINTEKGPLLQVVQHGSGKQFTDYVAGPAIKLRNGCDRLHRRRAEKFRDTPGMVTSSQGEGMQRWIAGVVPAEQQFQAGV